MKHVNKVTKKDRELRHAGVFLQRIGEVPKQWNIIDGERERPDLLLRSPTGEIIGLEMTELLTANHGKLRTAERLVCAAIQEIVGEFIESMGIVGALVDGNNRFITPPHDVRIDELRVNLRRHLEVHGQGLRDPNGSMRIPFKHEWGSIARIHRSETPVVDLSLDRPDHAPPYKGGRPLDEIEAYLLVTIEDKVKKANGYSNEWPLWLAIRNPNQQVGELSSICIEQARRLNGERFVRIILFNDPEDVLDASPPPPHCVEIC